MINKEQFIYYMNELKKAHHIWSHSSNRLAEDSGTHFVYPTFGLFELVIEMLEYEMEDDHKIIQWYIWDLDFGADGKDCMTTKKGESLSLTNTEELYDYLAK